MQETLVLAAHIMLIEFFRGDQAVVRATLEASPVAAGLVREMFCVLPSPSTFWAPSTQTFWAYDFVAMLSPWLADAVDRKTAGQIVIASYLYTDVILALLGAGMPFPDRNHVCPPQWDPSFRMFTALAGVSAHERLRIIKVGRDRGRMDGLKENEAYQILLGKG